MCGLSNIKKMLKDLDFNKPPGKTRIVVAMSGGVDSSVTAALLAKAGFEVIGMTMQLYDHGQAVGKKGSCCAGQDIYDARRVAECIGFPHYVLDYESRFQQSVIDDFVDSYAKGYTPLPCVRCNQTVKFQDLLTTAKELDADALATGHYVQRIKKNNLIQMHKAIDPTKDQSFFLFATTIKQLEFLRFPLGSMTKVTTRKFAEELGITVANKPDSQDICFVPEGNYSKIVEKLKPGALEPGNIVSIDGKVLGQHQGTINFTIGQRRGLGISSSKPLYVVDIDVQKHLVTVGPKESLTKLCIQINDVNWLGDAINFDQEMEVTAKIRSTQNAVLAKLILHPENKATILLDQPEYGVAPGQACVFYDHERVLGGGWIESSR